MSIIADFAIGLSKRIVDYRQCKRLWTCIADCRDEAIILRFAVAIRLFSVFSRLPSFPFPSLRLCLSTTSSRTIARRPISTKSLHISLNRETHETCNFKCIIETEELIKAQQSRRRTV